MRKLKYWIIANGVGVTLFLYFSSWGWAPEGDQGALYGAGAPIVWVLSVLPVIIVSSIINVIWILLMAFALRRDRNWRTFVAFLVVAAAWYFSIAYDHSREYHGNEIKGKTVSTR